MALGQLITDSTQTPPPGAIVLDLSKQPSEFPGEFQNLSITDPKFYEEIVKNMQNKNVYLSIPEGTIEAEKRKKIDAFIRCINEYMVVAKQEETARIFLEESEKKQEELVKTLREAEEKTEKAGKELETAKKAEEAKAGELKQATERVTKTKADLEIATQAEEKAKKDYEKAEKALKKAENKEDNLLTQLAKAEKRQTSAHKKTEKADNKCKKLEKEIEKLESELKDPNLSKSRKARLEGRLKRREASLENAQKQLERAKTNEANVEKKIGKLKEDVKLAQGAKTEAVKDRDSAKGAFEKATEGRIEAQKQYDEALNDQRVVQQEYERLKGETSKLQTNYNTLEQERLKEAAGVVAGEGILKRAREQQAIANQALMNAQSVLAAGFKNAQMMPEQILAQTGQTGGRQGNPRIQSDTPKAPFTDKHAQDVKSFCDGSNNKYAIKEINGTNEHRVAIVKNDRGEDRFSVDGGSVRGLPPIDPNDAGPMVELALKMGYQQPLKFNNPTQAMKDYCNNKVPRIIFDDITPQQAPTITGTQQAPLQMQTAPLQPPITNEEVEYANQKAEAAKKAYEAARKDVADLEAQLANVESSLPGLEAALTTAKENKAAKEKALNALQEEVNKLAKELEDQEKIVGELKTKVIEAVNNEERAQEKVEKSEEKVKSLKESVNNLEENKKDAEQRATETAKAAEEARAKVGPAETRVKELSDRLKSFGENKRPRKKEFDLSTEDGKADYKAAMEAYKEKKEQIRAIKIELGQAKRDVKNFEKIAKAAESENKKVQKEIEKLSTKLKKETEKLDTANKELESNKDELKEKIKLREEAEKELKGAEDKKAEIKGSYDKKVEEKQKAANELLQAEKDLLVAQQQHDQAVNGRDSIKMNLDNAKKTEVQAKTTYEQDDKAAKDLKTEQERRQQEVAQRGALDVDQTIKQIEDPNTNLKDLLDKAKNNRQGLFTVSEYGGTGLKIELNNEFMNGNPTKAMQLMTSLQNAIEKKLGTGNVQAVNGSLQIPNGNSNEVQVALQNPPRENQENQHRM